MRIGLFVTCLTDTLFPDTGQAVVTVLERLGHQVDFPAAQACCGQMHFNTGYRREAVPMARGFAAAFGGYEAVVTPSASCASMIREYYPALAAEAGDPGLARAVAELAPRTYELSVFLTGVLGVTDVGAYFPHRVTYHPSCHSLRMLGVGDAPLRLLRAVRGLNLADLPDAEACCGFGGTFAVKNADVSAAICADKVAAVRRSGAEVLCAADNSCLMHIGGALRGSGPGWRSCTWPRSWPAPRRPVTGRAPGGPGDRAPPGSMPTYLGMPSFPAAARTAVADSQLRANLTHATHTIRAKRAGAVAELADWEQLREAAKAIKDHTLAHLDTYLLRLEENVTRAGGHVHWAPGRGRGQRDRGRPGPRGRRRRRGQGEVDGHPGDRAERGAGRRRHQRAGDRPGRAHRPARPRPAQPHPGPGHPPEPGRDQGDLPQPDAGRAGRADRRPAGPGRRRAVAPAPGVPVRAGRRVRRELRDRRDRIAGGGRVRGQRPDVPDAAADAHLGGGDREDPAVLAGPGGVPRPAAPVLHRRADEPVHLDLDRDHARRRAGELPPGAAGQRPHLGAGRPDRPPGAALHQVLGLPERVPGLRADRRPRLRLALPGPDRRDHLPAAARRHLPGRRVAALRLHLVRRLLRGVPGRDQHPRGAGAPARQGRRREAREDLFRRTGGVHALRTRPSLTSAARRGPAGRRGQPPGWWPGRAGSGGCRRR